MYNLWLGYLIAIFIFIGIYQYLFLFWVTLFCQRLCECITKMCALSLRRPMESAVESSPIVTNKGITLPEVESASIVSESEKPILSAVETVESPSTISENKELTPSAVKDKDVSIVSECKKTTPCAVETNYNEDVTIVSESTVSSGECLYHFRKFVT